MIYYTIIVFLLCFGFIFYISRHTWASIARENGVSLSIISEGMGHTSEKTTRIYLASLNQVIMDEANRKVLSSIK